MNIFFNQNFLDQPQKEKSVEMLKKITQQTNSFQERLIFSNNLVKKTK